MKAGADSRKKTILAGVLGAAALICVFIIYKQLFPEMSTPPPVPVAAKPNGNGTNGTPVNGTAAKTSATTNGKTPVAVAGVDAKVLEKTSSSLDPTLQPAAMLRTEGLVYSGNGRNIFSLTYIPPAPKDIPKPIQPVRQTVQAPVYTPPQQPVTCPPTCPPINLKFFGTAARGKGGPLQAFLLQGEDVYLASQGDIVARKYKIVSISAGSIQVEDLSNTNTQTLPLQLN